MGNILTGKQSTNGEVILAIPDPQVWFLVKKRRGYLGLHPLKPLEYWALISCSPWYYPCRVRTVLRNRVARRLTVTTGDSSGRQRQLTGKVLAEPWKARSIWRMPRVISCPRTGRLSDRYLFWWRGKEYRTLHPTQGFGSEEQSKWVWGEKLKSQG